eukprot:7065959-Alexandrium_andersonii.AAC.1
MPQPRACYFALVGASSAHAPTSARFYTTSGAAGVSAMASPAAPSAAASRAAGTLATASSVLPLE